MYPPQTSRCEGAAFRRFWLVGLLSMAVVTGCGDGSEDESRGPRAATPMGVPAGEVLGRYDVGDHELNLRCYGSGSPAVIFETAHATDSGAYMNLASQVGAKTRACVYDRANLGLSDPVKGPRDGLDTVEDLTALLAAAKVPPPYVLAGHSHGALLSLLHAAEHPGDVRGLVLLDAVHPEFATKVDSIIPASDRLRRRFEAEGQRKEPLDIDLASAQLRSRLDDVPHVPTTVITATRFDDLPARWPREKLKRAWLRYQDKYAAMIPGARHVTTDTHQYDMWSLDPSLVVGEIIATVRAARGG